ncbi:hypothetical protein FPZ24_01785 [Sphingomonas panacisoli]|uniref:DNA binding HTH domain-containing protein n=1 Tax=Sphingomonas panacisoli TaxID=1813879 RepID=A0A5B8LEI6_9SPHN|nr:hypothetical protein [Sphingomonas panacisoli]QDZ06356.1 hypothetical protein FPZ24_01785 [Sphingomonas panacisoli]
MSSLPAEDRMPIPLTRAQQMENAAFLRHLQRTGNATTAARALGVTPRKFNWRRGRYSAFALRWDAALAMAHAALSGARAGTAVPSSAEPNICRTKGGQRQLRRAQTGLVDHAARQRFLAALCATANVSLSAAAGCHSASTFYRIRDRDPGFAREWRLALEMGYERLKMALLESTLAESFADDDWRRNDPPAIPPMTANQALQLMYLHQKEVHTLNEPPHLKRRRGESREAHSFRLAAMYEAGLEEARLKYRIAEAERLARGEPTYHRWAPGELPDLSQVTGWSKAKGKPPTDPTRALFGGWRLEDIPEAKDRS